MVLNWTLQSKTNSVTTFLDELSDYLLEHHGDHLRDVIVVLPARRSALFLKRAMSKRSQHTGWLPDLLTMSELLERMAGMQRADGIDLLFDLFTTWRETIDPDATFEGFMQWGPIALSDFNELDHHLASAKDVFKNLHDFKEIEAWSFSLDQENWSPEQKAHSEFWLNLGKLYNAFQERMEANGAFYGGAIARAVSKDPTGSFARLGAKHVIIAGLNALTTAEHKIIKALTQAGVATYRWDADRYYTEDKRSEAGLFIRRFNDLDPTDLPRHLASRKKTIRLVGCSSAVTQMHYVGNVLREVPDEQATDTAVILPDNGVLPVLLPAVPEHFSGINITMGRALSHTPYRSLIAAFFHLLDARSTRLRYAALMPFLRHPFTGGRDTATGKQLAHIARSIISENAVFIGREEIDQFLGKREPQPLVQALFDAVFKTVQTKTPANVIEALRALQALIAPIEGDSDQRRQGWHLLCGLTARIDRLCTQYPVINELREFQRIYQRLFGQLQIDLVGEPLIGLQIMGLLESRALDFKRVIIVNANENTLPRHLVADTFLPPDLRAHLHLPSARERDAYYAYYFYRLLQRAEEVHVVYTAGESGHDEGEKSRYIQQIETCQVLEDSVVEIEHLQVMARSTGAPPELLPIRTSSFTQERVAAHLKRGLSPSAFNLWLQNPREFFFRYVMGLGEQDDVEEEMEHRTLGTVVHQVMENIFEPMLNISLNPEALKAARAKIEPLLQEALQEHYNIQLTHYGVNYLLKKVALSFANKLLDVSIAETKSHDIVITGLEKDLQASLAEDILIRGNADRIDNADGTQRIIDYKTGAVAQKDLDLTADWKIKLSEGSAPKVLQCLIYAWIAAKDDVAQPPLAGIISARNHRSGFMSVRLNKRTVYMDHSFAQEFEAWMTETIAQLKAGLSEIGYDADAKYPTYSVSLGQ